MKRPLHLHHIHRIDDDSRRTHAWVVRVQRRGDFCNRWFSDGRHDGKNRALLAAIRFRDTVLPTANGDNYMLWRRNRKRRNNTSGIVGIGRYVTRERSRHGIIIERQSWQAFWDGPDGSRRCRKFSITHHGEKRAKDLALRARRDAMRMLFGTGTSHL